MSICAEIFVSINSSIQSDGYIVIDEISSAKRLYEPEVAIDLYDFLNVDNSATIAHRTIRHADFNIKCSFNRYDSGSSVYQAANLKTDMFDFVLRFIDCTDDNDTARLNIEKILRFYWDKRIPAAMFSVDIDERELKWQGGNQLSKVFWEDKHFTKAMYSVFSQHSIDYSE